MVGGKFGRAGRQAVVIREERAWPTGGQVDGLPQESVGCVWMGGWCVCVTYQPEGRKVRRFLCDRPQRRPIACAKRRENDEMLESAQRLNTSDEKPGSTYDRRTACAYASVHARARALGRAVACACTWTRRR
eukprot:483010-Pleurochrysis_carterae.AAC.4